MRRDATEYPMGDSIFTPQPRFKQFVEVLEVRPEFVLCLSYFPSYFHKSVNACLVSW